MQKVNELNFYILDTINQIPQPDWNNLFGSDIIESYGYHKTLEESGLDEFSIHYLVGKRGQETIAIVPFFTMDFSLTTIIRGRIQKIILGIRKLLKRFLKMRILFVGAPMTEHLYIGISEKEDSNLIFKNILEKLSQFSRKYGIKTMTFYNLTNEHAKLRTYLEKNGFHCMEDLPNSQIQMKFANIEEYINTMGSSTRKDIRRKLKKSCSMVKLETQVVDNIENEIEEIYKLYMNNFNDSDIRFEVLTPQFFINISRNMDGCVKYFLTRDNGKLVAFNLCFVKNDCFIDKVIGLDYSCAYDYSLYYTTLFYNIDWCIKNGVRYYQPGQGDYDAKIRLGAKLIPLYLYVKTANPLLSLFAKPVTRLIAPKNFDPALKNLAKYKIQDN
jgi:predicted N-acyltransferase